MRDRLIELIAKGSSSLWGKTLHGRKEQLEYLADYLLDNGVVCPPCKVGDTVHCIFEGEIRELKVISFSVLISSAIKHSSIHTTNSRGAVLSYEQCDFNKTVFLTKEEAERALIGGESDD